MLCCDLTTVGHGNVSPASANAFCFFCSPAPVLGCQAVRKERDSAAISAEEQRACDKGFLTLPKGPQMLRQVGLYFNQGQTLGFIMQETTLKCNGNISFSFVYLCIVYPSVSPVALVHLFIGPLGH